MALKAVRKEIMFEIKHGGSGTPLYNVWKSMRQRCLNPQSNDYRWYGAMGVTICKEWEDFKMFRDWALSSGYAKGLTIDRIDFLKGYEPENCRWITIQDQQQNKRNVKEYEVNGVRHTTKEWCDIIGIKPMNFHDRLHKGWSVERIVTTPLITREENGRAMAKRRWSNE